MPNYVYPAIGLIGGTAGFLDAIDGTNLADKDMAVVSVQGDKTYFYVLDVDSAAAEASPGIIAPDANGGDKRWILTGFTPVPAATGFTIAGGTTSKTLTVSGDAEVGQAWTTPSFDAANFTASGSMTWTVEAGDVSTYSYVLLGKVMVVNFDLITTTVGGTPDSWLYIKIPGSKTATKNTVHVYYAADNNVPGIGLAFIVGGQTTINLLKLAAGGSWTASTNLTRVSGSCTFEVN